MSIGENILVNPTGATNNTTGWTVSEVSVSSASDIGTYFVLGPTAYMEQLMNTAAFILSSFSVRISALFLLPIAQQTIRTYAQITFQYGDLTKDTHVIPLVTAWQQPYESSIGTWYFSERNIAVTTDKVLTGITLKVASDAQDGGMYVRNLSVKCETTDISQHEDDPHPHNLPLAITVGQEGIKGTKGQDVMFWLKDTGDAIFAGELKAATGTIGTVEGKQLIVNAQGEVTLPALTITGLDGHPTIQAQASSIETIDDTVSQLSSSLTMTASEIRAEFAQADTTLGTQVSTLSSSLSTTASTLRSEFQVADTTLQNNINTNTSLINQTATEIRLEVSTEVGRIDGELDTATAQITATANEIWLGVSSTNKGASLISEINLSQGSVVISASKINLEGAVSFASLDESVLTPLSSGEDAWDRVVEWTAGGTTLINGANIQTGTISATAIKTDELIVGTNITLGPNAKIKWGQVTDESGEQATAETVGARPDNWMPTAADVGARPSTWMPSAEDVGAVTSQQLQTVLGQDYIITGKINANQVTAGTLTGFFYQSGLPGTQRIVVGNIDANWKNAVVCYNSANQIHGPLICDVWGNNTPIFGLAANNVIKGGLYYDGDIGKVFLFTQNGTPLKIEPTGNMSIGCTDGYTLYLGGRIDVSQATWVNGSLPAVFS